MSRFALRLACFLSWLFLLSSFSLLQAQTITKEEIQKLDVARAAITRIDTEQEKQAESFDGLLGLREELAPFRDDVRSIVGVLQQRRNTAQARLAEFGAAPAANAPPEPAQNAAERGEKQTILTEIDTHLRSARALLVQADQLWDELTDARRDLFNARIFEHHGSFVYPKFWRGVFRESLPDFHYRISIELAKVNNRINAKQGWPILLGLIAFVGLLGGALYWLHVWLMSRRKSLAPSDVEEHSKTDILIHAAIVFAMRVIPFASVATIIWFTVTYYDIVPEEVQAFLLGLSGSLAVYGIGNGAARAVFSPASAGYRMIRTSDRAARQAVRVLHLMLLVYLTGLVVLGGIKMLSAHVSLTITVTGLMSLALVLLSASALFRAPQAEAGETVAGVVHAPLHLLRPILWMLAIVIIGSLLLGFIAFAGFVVGRALATAIILCLAILVYVAIDTIFYEAIAPGRPTNLKIAYMFGFKSTTVDLIGTIIAGTLRVLTVILTVLVLLSPWGIEFGHVDPFADVFFGLRFNDLRGWIGAAGIALVLFSVGLVATRLFVSWLNNQLLPRTNLNTGVRHSITTVSGYVGFIAALAIALGQAGVQIQNVALVAGALSVGIGFGLQQVVSNFVAGLIVLAERPVRVGDVIVVKGEEGEVRNISVRATEILLSENSTIIVPNSDMISSIVKNRTFVDPTHRASVKFLLDHDANMKLVFETLRTIARVHPKVIKDKPPTVLIKSVTENGIEIDLGVLCDSVANLATVRSDLYYLALIKFRELGIGLAKSATPALPAAPAKAAEG